VKVYILTKEWTTGSVLVGVYRDREVAEQWVKDHEVELSPADDDSFEIEEATIL